VSFLLCSDVLLLFLWFLCCGVSVVFVVFCGVLCYPFWLCLYCICGEVPHSPYSFCVCWVYPVFFIVLLCNFVVFVCLNCIISCCASVVYSQCVFLSSDLFVTSVGCLSKLLVCSPL